MEFFKSSACLIFLICIYNCHAVKPPVVTKKTMLCGNDDCTEVLFTTTVTRDMDGNHVAFLNLKKGATVDVVGVKFSDRLDIMQGRLGEVVGNFYHSVIDKKPYIDFLHSAAVSKKVMKKISTDPLDSGPSKVVGIVHSDLELTRDYNVQSRNYALEMKLTPPAELPIPVAPQKGHGHSHDHGGHGHSHGAHGHSHDDGHSHDGHSHEAPKVESSPPKVEQHVPVKAEAAVPPATVAETTVTEPLMEKIAAESVEEELNRMMEEDLKTSQELLNKKTIETPVVPEATTPTPPLAVPTTAEILAAAAGHKLPPPPVPVQTTQPPLELKSLTLPPLQKEQQIPPPVVEIPPVAVTEPTPVDTPTPAPEVPVVEELATPAPVVEPVVSTTLPPPADVVLPSMIPDPSLSFEQLPTPPVTTTPSPIPEDPLPTVAEEGYCDGDDCNKVLPPAVDESALPSVPVIENKPDEINQVEQPVVPEPPSTAETVVQEVPEEVAPTTSMPPPLSDDALKPSAFEDNLSTDHTDFVDMEALHNSSPPSGPGLIGGLISSMFGITRSILPVGDLSDAGVGLALIAIFVLTAFVIHLVSKLLLDSGDSVQFDRQMSHDLATKVIKLQEQLKIKTQEADAGRMAQNAQNVVRNQEDQDRISELNMQFGTAQLELRSLHTRLAHAESEAAREKAEREDIERVRAAERGETANAEQRARDAERELSSTKSALSRVETDLRVERHKLESLTTKYDEAQGAARSVQKQLEDSKTELRKLNESNSELEKQYATMLELLEEQEKKINSFNEKKEVEAAESGGSTGWSDFGDEPVLDEPAVENTPPTQAVPITTVSSDVAENNFKELISLKTQLKKIEQELEQTKVALHIEAKRTKELEVQLEQKTKEYEDLKTEKNNSSEMMIYFKEKLTISEKDCVQLRNDLERRLKEIDILKEECQMKENKNKELDSELKKTRNELGTVEAQSFKTNRILEQKLRAAMEQIQLLSSTTTSFDVLNNSGSSLDREGAASRGAPLDFPSIPSVWDEGARLPPSRGRNSTISPDEDFHSSGPVPLPKKSRNRRSDRVPLREPSPSDGEKRKEKKDGGPVPRRRSRSAVGRQQFNGPMGPMPPFIPGGPGYNPYEFPMYPHEPMGFHDPLNRRLSKSGRNVYYSSGGSGGGRSPPPMPQGSVQPPPGIRKPASKRATAPDDFGSGY